MKTPVLNQFNPSGKLLINILFLISALLSSNIHTSMILLTTLILSGIFFRGFSLKQIPVLIPFSLFALSLIWMNGLWGQRPPGDNIQVFLGFEFSATGLRIGSLLAMRVIIIILSGLLFTMSSPAQELILSLMQQLSFPPGIAYALLSAMNLISDIKRDKISLDASYRIKKGKSLNIFKAIIPLLAINIRRCESISLAMEARGFCINGKRTYFRKVPWLKKDIAFIVIYLLLILTIFVISYLNGLYLGYASWNGYQ
ncbi:MAG: energy-coupling factor transporter transmembrane component T [Spirochaetales bacterium]|uniref:Energy-coupling factor transporter transmembrane component T n=1 Tax=Candidatus Thalassospirochaeta sargassi TaxID=3119039 RepID=A0AAJ1IEL5_9SPIO|nr:energy-coupling factor transporter transmembrane component T [Spirochaetales bacterium]